MASAFNDDAHSYVIAASTTPNGHEASPLAGRRSAYYIPVPPLPLPNLGTYNKICPRRIVLLAQKERFGAVERNESDLNVDGGNKSLNDEKEISRECQEKERGRSRRTQV